MMVSEHIRQQASHFRHVMANAFINASDSPCARDGINAYVPAGRLLPAVYGEHANRRQQFALRIRCAQGFLLAPSPNAFGRGTQFPVFDGEHAHQCGRFTLRL
ncbi:MAG: hypothetical protein ACI4L8_01575 [Candidatus Fimadaptatus sp.]